MNRRSLLLGVTGLGALIAGGLTWREFEIEITRARTNTTGRSLVVPGRFGDLEFAQAGTGPPVLMIHGTGGGFDQGLDFARRLSGGGWQVIAPSRFGYLRSAFPSDPSSENQADAFVELLDHLSIDRIPIIGGSAGALSALQFAIRHPGRCSALITLVPAAYAPGRPPVEPPSVISQTIIDYALKSDLLFWAGVMLNEDAMISSLLATDPALLRSASFDEQSRVRAILRNILPVSKRAKGLMNDAKLAYMPTPMPLNLIRAPTLAISLEDDGFQTLAAARHIAESVAGAQLLSFPEGGHIWVGHDREVFEKIALFLSHASA